MSAEKRPKLRLTILLVTLVFLLFQVPFQAIEVWRVNVDYGFSIPEGRATVGEEVSIWSDESQLPGCDYERYGYLFDRWTTPPGEEHNLDLLDNVNSYFATFSMPSHDVTFIANFDIVERPDWPNVTGVVGFDHGLTVYWDPPSHGAEPVEYRVSLGESYESLPGDARSHTFYDLENGVTYEFYIYAVARGGVEGLEASQGVKAGAVIVETEPETPEPTEPPIETEPEKMADVENNFLYSIAESAREHLKLPPRHVDSSGSGLIEGLELNPESRWLPRLRPWLNGDYLLDLFREKGEPRDVTLQLVDAETGSVVHGGGDLYLSTESDDKLNYTAEIFPNDADHNPIVRKLTPGVRYRFAQLMPTPEGYCIPDDYLFYLDNEGHVRNALSHEKIGLSGPNVVTIETSRGIDVLCSIRSTAEPDKELIDATLEVEHPSDYSHYPGGSGSTYWSSTEQPMKVNVNGEWGECVLRLNEPIPGYEAPEPIVFRANHDADPAQYPLQVKNGDEWLNYEGNHLILMVQPSQTFPVRFSVVEAGTEQAAKGFSAFVINNWMKRLEDGWETEELPDGKELMLAPGEYSFNATNGPPEYAAVIGQHFRVDGEGKLFVRETSDSPWTEKEDRLIRLEAVKGKIVTIHTIFVDTEKGSWQLPDVVLSLIGSNGKIQSFVSGSDPLQIGILPDVLYELEAFSNPWDAATTGKVFFKVDAAGQLFLGGEDGQLFQTEGADIVLEFRPDDQFNVPQTCFAAAVARTDPSTPLPGATMALYRSVEAGEEYAYRMLGMTWVTTNEVRKLSLFPGIYYIEQLSPPPPYTDGDVQNTIQAFKIERDGVVKLLPSDSGEEAEDRVVKIYSGE